MLTKISYWLTAVSFSFILSGGSLLAQAEPYGSDWKYLGYSAIVPGLGQFKKDRPVYGSIALGGFVLLTANLAGAYQNFKTAEQIYQEKSIQTSAISSISLQSGMISTTSALLMRVVVNNRAFVPYNAAKDNANNAVMALGIFYIAQALNAFFLKPGGETAFGSDEKSFLSGFDLKMSPERSVFGTGTNLQMSWSGRY